MRIGGLLIAGALSVLAACSDSATEAPAAPADGGVGTEDAAAPATAEVVAVFDLPREASTEALSATWFEASSRTLYAIQDKTPTIVPLRGSEDFKTWTVGTPITLTGRPTATWDGEGLTRKGDVFFAVTVETEPRVERFDPTGAFLGPVDIPPRFADQAPGNKGLESLTLSPSGKFLFTANEAALTTDGATATKSRGTTVRVLRRDLDANADQERAYRTEPLGAGSGGDMGVSDLAAVSDDTLLVLERGYQSGYGNTVRIFRVSYGAGADVSSVDALDAQTKVLDKTLVVDLGELPSDGVTHPSTQPNPILDNYEALAIGPKQSDGRTIVFVTSDDNASATQVARVLVLALPLGE